MNHVRPLVLASIVLAASVPAVAQEYRVIVHPSNSVQSLSAAELSQVFLKTRATWDNGTAVEPVDLVATSSVRERFTQAVHGRSVDAIQSYWQKQIFAGRTVPPAELKSDDEVVAFVRDHPGGIGYVSSGASLSGVKVLDVGGGSTGATKPPERSKYVAPQYPPLARRAGAGGAVVLQIVISPAGDVIKVTVIKGLPYGLTDEAVKAVQQWKFKPAMRGGQPVEAAIDVTVQFSL